MSEDHVNDKADAPSTRKKRRRRAWPMVLLGAVILFSGMVIGGGMTLLWVQRRIVYMIHHPENAPATITAHVRSKFGLTDEQAKQVEAVLQARQKGIQAIRREFQPKIMVQVELARDEVAAVLTPEQAQEWKAYFDSMRKKWVPPPPGADAEP